MLLDVDKRRSQDVALFDIVVGDDCDLGCAGAVRWADGWVARMDEVRRECVEGTADLALCAVWRAGLLDILGTGRGFGLGEEI